MSIRKLFPLLGIMCSSALWSADNCLAEEITILASQDTYIRFGTSTIRNTVFNNDGNGLITGPSGYCSLVQFDLSGLAGKTITSAYIRGYLFADTDGDYNRPEPFAQELYLVDTDPNVPEFDGGMDETTMTWNRYVAALNLGATEILMDSLGRYEAPGAETPNEYKDFQPATPNDLAALNARVAISNPNQRFALFFFDAGILSPEPSGFRWWGDKETIYNATPEFPNTSAHPMQLVLTVEGGLPGDFNLDGFVDAADYVVWRKNPDQFNYDEWRTNFGNPAAGAGSINSGAVPEPGILCLLPAVLVALLQCWSRRARN